MRKRGFGDTKVQVTALGLGTAELGLTETSQHTADRVLNAALDLGINVIDTAACYGDSEVKIGKAIAGRRDEYLLVSKCGHRTGDLQEPPEWTGEIVQASIERSLRRLQTDHLDLLLLHSCTDDQLDNEDMIAVLEAVKQEGLTRWIGYSGDGFAAQKAIDMGVFDALEISVSIADQASIDEHLPQAARAGLGVLAKRPVANRAWGDLRDMGEFYVGYARPYAERLQAMNITPEGVGFDGSWMELALRFTVYQPGVSTAITGSRNPDHIRQNVEYVEKGPLPQEVQDRIRVAWQDHAQAEWVGLT